MRTRTLSADPIRGKVTRFHSDDDSYVIESVQDVTHVIDKNKARMALTDENARWSPDGFDQVAEIPPTVWADIWRKGIPQDEKRFRKWLDDRDQLAFRTRPGSLSK